MHSRRYPTVSDLLRLVVVTSQPRSGTDASAYEEDAVADAYAHAWESYWQDTPGSPGEAIWDSEPSLAAGLHHGWFAEHFDPALPVVDLGCGNGTQARYLATRYGRVIGVDLSETAIALARAADPARVVDFRVLNVLDEAAVHGLHEELGDANVYMRGIIHQSRPEDRPRVAAAVATLVGASGAVFDVEMAAASKAALQALARDPEGPPAKVASIFSHGLTPSEVADDDVPEMFRCAGLRVLGAGDTTLFSTEVARDGARIDLPMRYLIARR
jgi:2-polyprenyl-3-methyl-5-hydroxy-6-metoxy-1,4-benzoquinol methylase